MEKKWTPGPWGLNFDILDAELECGIAVATAYIYPPGPYRGDVTRLQSCENICGIDRTQMTANAHLIAAAPEMYDALEDIEGRIEFASRWINDSTRWDEELSTPIDDYETLIDYIFGPSRAVLAKARGETE